MLTPFLLVVAVELVTVGSVPAMLANVAVLTLAIAERAGSGSEKSIDNSPTKPINSLSVFGAVV